MHVNGRKCCYCSVFMYIYPVLFIHMPKSFKNSTHNIQKRYYFYISSFFICIRQHPPTITQPAIKYFPTDPRGAPCPAGGELPLSKIPLSHGEKLPIPHNLLLIKSIKATEKFSPTPL